ncbi:MCE family protein [Gandjariella thermophila]|uniref:ABC transporter substrate-binding protein n=1 Tax=Gandjariella thermophila TaxID=1931992 RepID=A0A4D4J9U6_9PSEU|nr:MCE family protein [Gandjariella thermophila]GDY31770.1 ABC transporter substrate-binding protein [Gandjariella thermophila]
MSQDSLAWRIRRRLIGIAYISVLIAFLLSTVAVYKKVFEPVVHVTLRTDHVGNQLQPPSDVKVRGLIVGEVRSVRATGSGAELDLALRPDEAHLIPRNVSARLLPKTVFGERYVSLVLPDQSAPASLTSGDVIDQDHSSTSIEVEKVLGDLMPLLQAVQPEKLATTLNTISMTLDGRGQELGQTMVDLNRLLVGLNPALPDMTADISALADVSRTYANAVPDLAQALHDMSINARTVAEQRAGLDRLYRSLTTASNDMDTFLRANKDNLIALNVASRPTNELLARYAPEYPCLLHDIVASIPETDRIAGKGTSEPGVLHLTVKIAQSRGKYLPGQDTPRYDDRRGPRCWGTPVPAPQYPPDGPVRDGSSHPAPAPNPRPSQPGLTAPSSTAPAAAPLANSPAEQRLVAVLVAPALDVSPDDVPSWGCLLLGPLYRGAEVTVQ